MSTTRLPFLYPRFFRLALFSESATPPAWAPQHKNAAPSPSVMRCPYARCFASSTSPKQSNFRRHGKAVEPEPQPAKEEKSVEDEKKPAANPEPAKQPPTTPGTGEEAPDPSKEPVTADVLGGHDQGGDASPVIELGPPQEPSKDSKTQDGKKHKPGPMEVILTRSPLESMKKPPPHLTPPPYVHHFDSYSLVKQLEAGGFSQAQAITAMKAVRALLAQNLDVAQEGLVSKSDIENETYLFKAACSELSSEVRNNRRLGDEQLRQQRTTLQHEVDILTQSLNQEGLNLNDAMRGMFNDRKMAVREEQKTADSAIQQINYKITISLNSDAKSEIERLRGVLIRRAVFCIIFCAALTLATLQYASYTSHARAKEAEKKARDEEAFRKSDGRNDNSSGPDAAAILAAS